jgi:hypothetical protein
VGEHSAHRHFRSDRDDDLIDDAVFEHLDLNGGLCGVDLGR